MLFCSPVTILLAGLGIANAVPAEKRTVYTGEATVNPNLNGAIGSCGVDSPDSSFTVALSPTWMSQHAPSVYCGHKITLTNTGPTTDGSVGGKGKKVTVTVEDTCEGCDETHLDLSVAAWKALTNNHVGSVVGIKWNFL